MKKYIILFAFIIAICVAGFCGSYLVAKADVIDSSNRFSSVSLTKSKAAKYTFSDTVDDYRYGYGTFTSKYDPNGFNSKVTSIISLNQVLTPSGAEAMSTVNMYVGTETYSKYVIVQAWDKSDHEISVSRPAWEPRPYKTDHSYSFHTGSAWTPSTLNFNFSRYFDLK